MDTQSKDTLKQLLQVMDSQQHKLDQVMGRLDTLQNITERQNQKQSLLDEKLVEITLKHQQEKASMAEQMQAALQEIMEPFLVSDNQERCTPSPSMATQSLNGLGTRIGDKLKSIEDRTVHTAQQCDQLTLWSRQMEDKMTELAGNSVDMKTFLVEIRSVKDLINGHTNYELIYLNNQLDKKLSDIGLTVRNIHQQLIKVGEETVPSTGQFVKTATQYGNIEKPLSTEIFEKQMQATEDLERKIEQLSSSILHMTKETKTSSEIILTKHKQIVTDLENIIKKSVEEINDNTKEQTQIMNASFQLNLETLLEKMQLEHQTSRGTTITESEKQASRLLKATENAKQELTHAMQIEGDKTSKCKVDLENIHKLITSLVHSVPTNMAAVGNRIDIMKASMTSGHQTLTERLEEILTHKTGAEKLKELSIQKTVAEKLKELSTDLKDCISQSKREIFAVTEKEAQIVRDRIEGPLSSPGKYTFDFFVNNFKSLIRSGKDLCSLPWHINELQTCVSGCVLMSINGEMEVYFLYGRHVREVGMQSRSGKRLNIKATICDGYKKKLPSSLIGNVTMLFNEDGNGWNGAVGSKVGVTSCNVLLEQGFGDKEGYSHGALLIRYEVTVL